MTSVPTGETTRHRSPLLGRRSLFGALAILGVWAVFAFGLQWLSEALPADDGFESGVAYPVSPQVAITPADGWRRDASQSSLGAVVVAERGPGTFVVSVGAGSLKVSEAQARGQLEADKSGYKLSGSQPFTTSGGAKGSTFLAQSTDKTALTWVVVSGATTVQMQARAVPPKFAGVNGDVEDMAKSLRIETGP